MSNRPTSGGRSRLDWCCIGAQKAGTSSLYRLLRDHPQIVIPRSKEDPIFDAEVTAAEVRQYLDDRFAGDLDRQCGTVTPQYMSAPQTAARLHHFAPGARIIALLRDPVSRALSHYKMSVLRQLESRPFDEAVAAQLDVLQGGGLPDLDSETDTYVARGNYGWLLTPWFDFFPRDRLLMVFSNDLDNATEQTITSVQQFLGVEIRRPTELDVRFNANPDPHRLSALRRPVAHGLRLVGWNRIDVERRERITSRIERGLARLMPVERREMTVETEQRLRSYFAADRAVLSEIIGSPPPWPELAATEPS